MENYSIIKISEAKLDQLKEFFSKAFAGRSKILTRHWKWFYRNNFLGYEPIVIVFNNKIIAQAGLIPVKLKHGEEIFPATWFVDFVVLPEFQGKGIGYKLTKEWMKICPNQITFCNSQSLKIFKKLGWTTNYNTKRTAKLINPTKWIPLLDKNKFNFINKIYNFSYKKKFSNIKPIKPYSIKNNYKQILDTFFKVTTNQKKLAETLKDEDWLNWRLIESPFNKNFFFFEYKDNFAIANIFYKGNIKRVNILYTYYLNNLYTEDLFKSIISWALNNKVDLIWTNSNDQQLINKFENLFSNKFSKSLNFACYSSDSRFYDTLKLGLNNIQAIDSDNDINCLHDNSL